MKKIGLKIGMWIMLMGLIFLSYTNKVKAASYEQESNDSYASANTLPLNSSLTGNISERDNISERFDVDYYVIKPTANGKISLTFNHVYQNSSASWHVKIYLYVSGTYTELSETYIQLNDNEKISLPSIGAVKNGIYYIMVERNNSGVIGVDYTLTTNFEETELYEKENNDVYATASTMVLNNSISGNISKYDDKDYYVIKPTTNGKISLTFNHVYQDGYDSWHMQIYIYESGTYTELSEMYIQLNDNEKISLPSIGAVKNGIYYIMVEKNNSGVIGVDYTLTTNFEETELYEKENNNVYGTANTIGLSSSISGNISCSGDKDFYKFVAPKDGYYKISFGHNYMDNYDSWEIRIDSYIDGAYSELTSGTVALKDNKKVSFPLLELKKGITYYIVIERNNSEVIGVDYSLDVFMPTNGPSDIYAKVSKGAVKLSWTKVSSVSGYEVYYKIGKKGKYQKYQSTKKTTMNFSKAKKGKIYYFKVRGYVISDGKTNYSAFSKAKKVKCK